MKKFILACLLFLTVSIAFAKPLPKPRPTTAKFRLPSFSAINVLGPIHLKLRSTRSSKPSATRILSRNSHRVSASVKHHTLFLRMRDTHLPNLKPTTVKIRIYRLQKLNVYGDASVIGTNINSDGLVIKANTTGRIALSGHIKLDKLENFGPGQIKLRRITGARILIKCKADGHVTLTGSAEEMVAEVTNHAILDTQYLKTNHVMIKTNDFTLAKVFPINSLRAFATDFSNIYYYKPPKHLTRDASQSGNILQMGA